MADFMLALIFLGIIFLLVPPGFFLKNQISHGLVKVFHPLSRFVTLRKQINRRREYRLPFVTRGKCMDLTHRAANGAPFDSYLVDISPSGCQIVCEVPLPRASLVSLRIPQGRIGYRLGFVAYTEGLGKLYRAGLSFVPQGRAS